MVTLKQIRAKRTEVIALQAALEAAQIAHSESVKALTTAADNLKLAKERWVNARDILEDLGREFALDEGENDYTPSMTFEPPHEPVTKKVLEFPILKVKIPPIDVNPTTISFNTNGVKVKEWTKPDGTTVVEVVSDEIVTDEDDEIEGNLSIGPAGTPVPACTCGGTGGYDGKIDPTKHVPACPAYKKYDAEDDDIPF